MSTPINDGGPAFPASLYKLENGQESSVPHIGMTLRDYFAGQALSGLVLLREIHEAAHAKGSPAEVFTALACYEYADAMLAARKKVTK